MGILWWRKSGTRKKLKGKAARYKCCHNCAASIKRGGPGGTNPYWHCYASDGACEKWKPVDESTPPLWKSAICVECKYYMEDNECSYKPIKSQNYVTGEITTNYKDCSRRNRDGWCYLYKERG